jgi:hypothetical protein
MWNALDRLTDKFYDWQLPDFMNAIVCTWLYVKGVSCLWRWKKK